MKRNLLRLVMLFVTTVLTNSAFAQSSTLATLSHDGTISTYYGVTALKEAYNAAVDGDVITLASGSYLAIDLTKAVSICGAGMGLGAAKNIEPTILLGDFRLNLPSDNTTRFTIEGIYHNGEIKYSECQNAMFLKCRLYTITYYGTGSIKLDNISFVHCRITHKFDLYTNCSASLINCVVNEPRCFNRQSTVVFDFTNCVLKRAPEDLGYSSLRNCVFFNTTAGKFLTSTSVYNTVILSSSDIFTDLANNGTNSLAESWPAVFKTYRGTQFEDAEEFELADEAKTKYLGNDGTQVGIYGGNLPFDPTPSNPQITKCNVAAKSTADGKLSVGIEVKAAE